MEEALEKVKIAPNLNYSALNAAKVSACFFSMTDYRHKVMPICNSLIKTFLLTAD